MHGGVTSRYEVMHAFHRVIHRGFARRSDTFCILFNRVAFLPKCLPRLWFYENEEQAAADFLSIA